MERLSLARQFALVAGIVVGAGTLVLGRFISAEIEGHVVRSAAVATALHLNTIVAPSLQEFATSPTRSEESLRALDDLFKHGELGRRIVSVKIGLPDGRIIYSTNRDFIGKTFSANPELRKALGGKVAAQFESPVDESGAVERNTPLLAIYAPIRTVTGNGIAAIVQLFTDAAPLKDEIESAQLRGWVVVGAVSLLQAILLCGLVWRGNRTIEAQRVDAQRAAVETSERILRRIGADLHDGAAQLMSLALLRLDALHPIVTADPAKSNDFEKIRGALQDGLREIRHLSAGLAPPHLTNLPLRKIVELAVRQHEQRTGTAVNAAIGTLPVDVSLMHKVCIYRFVQEGLNNAYRHAGGGGQMVHVDSHGSELSVEVADSGPGFSPSNKRSSDALGLAGLCNRVESLGGKFSLETRLGSGTRIRASFQVADMGKPDS